MGTGNRSGYKASKDYVPTCLSESCDNPSETMYCDTCTAKEKESKKLYAQKKARERRYKSKIKKMDVVKNPITNYFKKKEKK